MRSSAPCYHQLLQPPEAAPVTCGVARAQSWAGNDQLSLFTRLARLRPLGVSRIGAPSTMRVSSSGTVVGGGVTGNVVG